MTTKYQRLMLAATSEEATLPGACWEWDGAHDRDGYGLVSPPAMTIQFAHRIAYAAAYGPIPKGMVIDHMCRNRGCWKPGHLRTLTNAQNVLDDNSEAFTAINARKTHCIRGHALEGDNLIPYYLKQGRRKCKACARLHDRRYYRQRTTGYGIPPESDRVPEDHKKRSGRDE